MAIRKIYVNPGDVIVMRVIDDPELPKNMKEWEYQIHPYSVAMTVNETSVTFHDASQRIFMQQPLGDKELKRIY